MNVLGQPWAAFGLRLGLAAVFIYAGAAKAPWPQRFALDVESYRLVPPSAAAWVAGYLPYLEVVAGLALLSRRVAAGATLWLGTLSAVFLAALLSAWARGLEIRCGCFGESDAPAADYAWWILRDGLLLGACVIVWRTLPRSRAIVER